MSVGLRIAVLSDVHGNLPALRAVLQDINEHGPFDRLVAAGDHCLNGPDPAGALDMVIEHCTDVLIGNADRDIADQGASDPDLGVTKRESIEWSRAAIGNERIELLRGLAFDAECIAPDGSALLVVHANPVDLDRHIFPDMPDEELGELTAGVTASVLAFGHLHVPFVRTVGPLTLANISACGLPRDGDRRAVWGEFEWSEARGWQVKTHRVAYDYGETVLRILDSGMPHPKRRIADLLRASYD